MSDSSSSLWQERLRVLREFYAVGVQILTETVDPKDTRISPRWRELDALWDQFLDLEQQLSGQSLPADESLRKALQVQARANATLFRSLEEHCREIQRQIAELLPSLPRLTLGQRDSTTGGQFRGKV